MHPSSSPSQTVAFFLKAQDFSSALCRTLETQETLNGYICLMSLENISWDISSWKSRNILWGKRWRSLEEKLKRQIVFDCNVRSGTRPSKGEAGLIPSVKNVQMRGRQCSGVGAGNCPRDHRRQARVRTLTAGMERTLDNLAKSRNCTLSEDPMRPEGRAALHVVTSFSVNYNLH